MGTGSPQKPKAAGRQQTLFLARAVPLPPARPPCRMPLAGPTLSGDVMSGCFKTISCWTARPSLSR